MKKLFLFLTMLSSVLTGYSQTDSTILHYKYIEDKDMINICELSDIQIQKIYCEDTLLNGKVFNFIIKEFKKGKSDYSLRLANSCSDNKIKVPINQAYPILAYSPPFDTGSNLQSYCLLGEENIHDWYSKFKVKHYYAIYIEIK